MTSFLVDDTNQGGKQIYDNLDNASLTSVISHKPYNV